LVGAVVLAAGASTRFGSPKQEVLLGEVVGRVRRSSVDEIVVVLGAYDVVSGAPTVHCPEWERGPGASLRCGFSALSDKIEAAVVVLGDGPDLAPEAIDRLIEAWRATGDGVLAAGYGGERGHPVLLARMMWKEIPDEGARALDPVLVACDDLGAPGDVDRPDHLPSRLRPGATE